MTLDKVFAQQKEAEDFRFDEKVAGVFDDMVDRSVPFYQEIQRMVSELAADYAVPGSYLCDLGCATGTTLALMDGVVAPDVSFIGIDNSPEMLERCRAKFEQRPSGRTPHFLCCDLKEMQLPENTSVVSMLLTLMFVRPVHRRAVLTSIVEALNPGGALILVEKVVCDSPDLNRRFIKLGQTLRSFAFNWRRVVVKEYSTISITLLVLVLVLVLVLLSSRVLNDSSDDWMLSAGLVGLFLLACLGIRA